MNVDCGAPAVFHDNRILRSVNSIVGEAQGSKDSLTVLGRT